MALKSLHVHDQLVTGRKLRVLTIVDTFSRFSAAADPRLSYRGEDVVNTLEKVCKETGHPKTIHVDRGSEFISKDLDHWAYQKGVNLDFSRPGKPTDSTRSNSSGLKPAMSKTTGKSSRRVVQPRGAGHGG